MCATLLFLLTFISFVSSESTTQYKEKCSNKIIEKEPLVFEKKADLDYKLNSPILIEVKFVVFHDDNKGKVSKNRINEQIKVLNEGFGGNHHDEGVDSNIKFKLKYIKYVNDKKLYESCGNSEDKIINSYPGNTKKYISVYVCDDDYLGYAYYPWHESEGHKEQVVFMNPIAISGSNTKIYSIGMTLVHELGHFFGLSHTFNDHRKCSLNGDDGFTDTPIEKTPNYGCNLKRDTCPNSPGTDPIWNYMDYTEDKCMNRFTKQQVDNMHLNIKNYRKKLKNISTKNYIDYTTRTTKPATTKTKTTTTKTKTTTTKTKTTTTKTIVTYTTTTKTKNMYYFCGWRKKSSCNKNKNCRWHDHYIKCYPNEHEDTLYIFCDVRKNEDQTKKSKFKCLSNKYKKKCRWNNKKKKCVPKY